MMILFGMSSEALNLSVLYSQNKNETKTQPNYENVKGICIEYISIHKL